MLTFWIVYLLIGVFISVYAVGRYEKPLSDAEIILYFILITVLWLPAFIAVLLKGRA